MRNTRTVIALPVATMIGLLATAQAANAFNELAKPARQTSKQLQSSPSPAQTQKRPPGHAAKKKTWQRTGERSIYVDETGVVRNPKP